MYKKIISLMLTAVLLTGILPTAALAAEITEPEPETETAEEIAVPEEQAAADPSGTEEASEESSAEEPAEAEQEEAAVPADLPEEDIPELVSAADADVPDNDTLFAGYVEEQFALGLYTDSEPAMFSSSLVGTETLTGNDLTLYTILKDKIVQIASGTLDYTRITIDVSELGLSADKGYSAEELGVEALTDSSSGTTLITSDASDAIKKLVCSDKKRLLSALLADCPYELYWFDKTVGWSVNIPFRMEEDGLLHLKGTVAFSMDVADEYSDGTKTTLAGVQFSLTADTAKTGATAKAAANARAIISKYSAQSDYDKLCGYRDEVLRLASYNGEAAASDYSGGYGDPWQLVWVFDGDASTSVVCEGYAKAFQYLCEMSYFDSAAIYCLSVYGYSGTAQHMWNIVHMDDGKNYLCDLTNSDGGIGSDGSLFLAGARSGSVSSNYKIAAGTGGAVTLTYTYMDTVLNLYPDSWLELSDTAYAASASERNDASVWVDETGITCAAELIDSGEAEALGLSMPHEVMSESYTSTPYCYKAELSAEATLVFRVPDLLRVSCLYRADTSGSWESTDSRYDYYAADGYGILTVSGAKSGYYAIAADEADVQFIDEESGELLTETSSLSKGEYGGTEYFLISLPAAQIETNLCMEYSYLLRSGKGEESAALINGSSLYIADHGTTKVYVRSVHRTDNLTRYEAAAPDCFSGGNSEYYICSDCGRYFTVTDGVPAEIEADSWKLSALGHDPDENEVCTRCGLELSGKLDFVVTYDGLCCGEPVTFTVHAAGGSGEYLYCFAGVSMNDAANTPVTAESNAYTDADSFEFTFMASGSYVLTFRVKDADTGADSIVTKSIAVTVEDGSYPDVTAAARKIAAECADLESDYEKALFLHDRLIELSTLDTGGTWVGAEGPLCRGTGTAEAYSRAYALLLECAGFDEEDILVETTSDACRLKVRLDGAWYHIDPAQDDPDSPEYIAEHLFFGLTDAIAALVYPGYTETDPSASAYAYDCNYYIASGELAQWSDPCTELAESYLAPDSEKTFVFTVPNTEWPEGRKNIVYTLAAAQLSGQTFRVNDVDYTVTFSYADDMMTCIVTDEDDSYKLLKEFVTRLYKTCLNREPDEDGLAYWIGVLQEGESGNGVVFNFFFSAEFENNNYCNRCFAERLYTGIFGREPDEEGLEYWISVLNNGEKRVNLVNNFLKSTEFQQICADYGIRWSGQRRSAEEPVVEGMCSSCADTDPTALFVKHLYTTCMDREADPSGLYYWYTGLKNGDLNGTEAAHFFITSPEFTGHEYSDEEYLRHLYSAMMGREADKEGLAYWLESLKVISRDTVFYYFAKSPEFEMVCHERGILTGYESSSDAEKE